MLAAQLDDLGNISAFLIIAHRYYLYSTTYLLNVSHFLLLQMNSLDGKEKKNVW